MTLKVSLLWLVLILILAQTGLVGVLLWRFRRFEVDALFVARKQAALEVRMNLLETRVSDGRC